MIYGILKGDLSQALCVERLRMVTQKDLRAYKRILHLTYYK